jgi:cell wall-associated NlpC family hydrolase
VDRRRFKEIYAELKGGRYRYGGQGSGGFDCSGLVGHVYREYNGMKLPRTVRELFRIGEPVVHERFQTGDLLFYETDGRGPSHVGIFLWNSTFLHASSSDGVVLTDTDDAYYTRRFLGARRLLH